MIEFYEKRHISSCETIREIDEKMRLQQDEINKLNSEIQSSSGFDSYSR